MTPARARYFDHAGHQTNEDTALDARGRLKDGYSMRVPMWMADAARATNMKAQLTDGSGDPLAGNRPGFRLRVGDARRKVADAHAEYQRWVTNRWRCADQEKVCPDCDGTGEIDGEDCSTCGGSGFIEAANSAFGSTNEPISDNRTVGRAGIYDAYDRDISQAWRGTK